MKMVRLGVLVAPLLLLAISGFPLSAVQAQVRPADEAALIQQEKLEWEVAKKKDWQAYNRLLSDDFVWIDDSGIILGRTPFLRYIADLDLTDYSLDAVKVTMFGSNVALVTYKVVLHGKFGGQAIPSTPSYIGSEYVRRGGRWVNVFTQTTGAKP